jgi:hypothetical protein
LLFCLLPFPSAGRPRLISLDIGDSKQTRKRNVEVQYVIGGLETTYRGLDGDEFRSSVRWDTSSLVFDTIEQEGSSEIPQKAVWTLSADGHALQVDRQFTKSGKRTHSLTTYIRRP